MGKGGRTQNSTTNSARNTSGVLSMSSNNGMAISGNTFDGAKIKVTDGGAIKAMAATSQQYLSASKSAIHDVMGNTGKVLNGALKTNDDIASKAIIASKDNLSNSLKFSGDTVDKSLNFNNNAMTKSYGLVSKMITADQAANKMAMANSASATKSALSIIHNVAENKTANSSVEIASVMKVAFIALAVAVAIRGK